MPPGERDTAGPVQAQWFQAGGSAIVGDESHTDPVSEPCEEGVNTTRSVGLENTRVVLVSHTGEMGGAERALLELVDGLREKQVECFVLLPKRDCLRDELQRRKVPNVILPYRWWISNGPLWKRPLREAMSLAAFLPAVYQLKQWAPHVIVTNTCSVCVGALAAAALKTPHVWFIHEFGLEDHGATFDLGIRRATRLINRFSDLVLVNSKAVGSYYSQYIPRERLRVVYQAVELGQDAYRAPLWNPQSGLRPVRLVHVARIEEGKGQLDAVQAVAELARNEVPAELTFVGGATPAYFQRVKRAVADHRLEVVVRFAGHVGNAATFIQESDIVLVCSRSEAFGRVSVEAMKLGRPVIGARAGATQELIRENVTGLLYSPGDPKDLASKIGSLVENPALAANLAAAGRRWAQANFTTERYTEQVYQALTEVQLAHAKRRGP